MNTAIGIALIVAAIYAFSIGVGVFFGTATGDVKDMAKAGAFLATVVVLVLGLIGAAAAVMIA